ncbi:MAG: cellulase family glycosylhydrolase [Ruminococcus sp.]|nr:cellulase family glycosylhydrolase [Ruminococcus sp.]
MFKSKIIRFISMASAVACITTCVNLSSVTNISDADAIEVKDAFTITEEMGLGWNLGNSLDAYDNRVETMGLESEICWGNPYTTKEMIDAVKAKGFNTIRVPVTWYQHVDKANGYKINAEYLARVKEVVDWCYNDGLYVILNLHHEEPYQNRATLGADYEEISGFVTSIWGQLAETFKDYDQHLIFETMNEPRATGTDHEWWGPHDDEVDTINKINADSLSVIRKAGGNNDSRLVMMPGYCASSDTTIMTKVIIPDDDFVAASVHAYSPYGFAMDAKADHTAFTDAYKNELVNIMDGIRKTFSDKDIPVVLGEFSSSNFDNTEARCDWATAYMETTKAYGFPCVLWDNNVKGNNEGEAHGYLNRSDLTWYEPSEPVIDAMIKVLDSNEIKWGSERKSPVISHDDISTGTVISDKKYELDSSIKDGNCTEGLNADWKLLVGGDVAVQFTGDAPVIAVVDGGWDNWTEIKPYDVDEEKGIAYYSSQHIESAWNGDVTEIQHIFARTNSKTVVTKMAVIGGGEVVTPPEEDNTKSYPIRIEGDFMTFIVEGTPGTNVNGCLGYMSGSDWTTIEWKGKIPDSGKLEVNIDTYNLPHYIDAQFQIWWSDDNSAELVNQQIWITTTSAMTTTTSSTTTTTTSGTTTITSTKPAPVGYIAGDANCDNEVNIADATAIVQHLGNKDKYALSFEGERNADVDGEEGITGSDALVLQQVEAKMISLADLPLKK